MKITKIKLDNFKFHTSLPIDIKGNMLLYGENGTGKSSIYWAMYSKLQDKNSNIQIYKKLKSSDSANVTITLDDSIPISDDIIHANSKTIYFANQDLLESMIDFDTNFFLVISNKFQKYFPMLEEYYINYERMNLNLNNDELEQSDIVNERKKISENFKNQLEKISTIANGILESHFHIKKTKVTFAFDGGMLNDDGTNFNTPNISLLINDINTLKSHFNEAVLKLSSLAIFLAFIKIQSKESINNELKILVLDDFLTSLDMANRKFIIEYILKNFQDYQKIILTHNLQFFNLIKKLTEDWDIKQMFILEETDGYVSHIKNDTNYLQEAEKFLKTTDYNLETAGHKLRKAYESIMQDFSQLLELGRYDSLENIVKTIKDADDLYFNPKQANLLIKDIFEIIQSTDTNDVTQEIKQKILGFQSLSIVEVEIDKVKENPAKTIIYKVNKAIIYKQILLNPASHNDSEATLYRRECSEALELLKNLNKIKKQLK